MKKTSTVAKRVVRFGADWPSRCLDGVGGLAAAFVQVRVLTFTELKVGMSGYQNGIV